MFELKHKRLRKHQKARNIGSDSPLEVGRLPFVLGSPDERHAEILVQQGIGFVKYPATK